MGVTIMLALGAFAVFVWICFMAYFANMTSNHSAIGDYKDVLGEWVIKTVFELGCPMAGGWQDDRSICIHVLAKLSDSQNDKLKSRIEILRKKLPDVKIDVVYK